MLSVITPGITMPAQAVTPALKREVRALLGLPAEARCLLFAGNDYRKKGLQALLEAMVHLPSDVVLAVVGNPAHIPAFRAQAEACKLGARVFFLGSLKDVGPAYTAVDCLVHPTLEDTFAMVVLEAMAHGLPVVVSGPRYCGISGLLQHGVNAMVLDDPRDADNLAQVIQQVLSQPALHDGLMHGAVEFATHYQWGDLALQQEALYFSALAATKVASSSL